MFDAETELIQEWRLPTPWSAPNDSIASKGGKEVWTGSMSWLDPKTDEFIEYLLPRSTNIRRVFLEETGRRPVLWVGSNNGASIVRVEPLD